MAFGTKIGTAYFDVDADTNKAENKVRALGKSIDGGINTASTGAQKGIGGLLTKVQAFGAVAGAVVGAKAITAIVDFGKASVDAASNLGESINAINVVYGEAATGVRELGADTVEQFGLSERAFNEFAVRFSSFAENIAGASGRKVEGVVEDITTRIADFASVVNLDMNEAATVIQSALAGETESFRRFGGDVSAAAVELKALELGLGKSSGELTEQEKILARYQLIMEQTDEMAGDFANTSDSLANQQRILTANVETLQAKIGGLLVPAVTEAVDAFNDLLSIVNDLIPGVQTGTDGISDFVSTVGRTFSSLIPLGQALGIAADWLDVFEANSVRAAAAEETLNEQYDRGNDVLEAYNIAGLATQETTKQASDEFSRGQSILAAYSLQGMEVARSADEVARATVNATEALDAHQDAVRAQTDPLFALFQATQAQAEAQAAVNEATGTAVEDTPEYTQMLADLFLANQDVAFAAADARVNTDLTKEAFINAGVAAGGQREQVEKLAEELFALEGIHLDPIQLSIEIRELRRSAGNLRGGVTEFAQAGGFITGPTITGEAGRELFIPTEPGTVIPHTQTEALIEAFGAPAFAPTINITLQGGATVHDARMVGGEIETVLRRLATSRLTQ